MSQANIQNHINYFHDVTEHSLSYNLNHNNIDFSYISNYKSLEDLFNMLKIMNNDLIVLHLSSENMYNFKNTETLSLDVTFFNKPKNDLLDKHKINLNSEKNENKNILIKDFIYYYNQIQSLIANETNEYNKLTLISVSKKINSLNKEYLFCPLNIKYQNKFEKILHLSGKINFHHIFKNNNSNDLHFSPLKIPVISNNYIYLNEVHKENLDLPLFSYEESKNILKNIDQDLLFQDDKINSFLWNEIITIFYKNINILLNNEKFDFDNHFYFFPNIKDKNTFLPDKYKKIKN